MADQEKTLSEQIAAALCDSTEFLVRTDICGNQGISLSEYDVIDIIESVIANQQGESSDLLSKAAQDLLAALEGALDWIEGDEATHGRKFGAGNVAREAIAKATGIEIESDQDETGEE